MKLPIHFTCPYCGHRDSVLVEKIASKEVITCDSEDGGCDKDFVLFWSHKPEVTTCKILKGDNND